MDAALRLAAGSAAGPADGWQLCKRLAACGKALCQLRSLRRTGGSSGSGQLCLRRQLRAAAAAAAPCCQPTAISAGTTAPAPCDVDQFWIVAS